MEKSVISITIIGTGNVAHCLGRALALKGFTIGEVYGRDNTASASLAKKLNATSISSLSNINTNASLYLICTSDDAIENIVANLPKINGVIAHTAGSVDMTLFSTHSIPNHGVFYPLQTLSKSAPIDFSNVPLCISGNNSSSKELLKDIAKSISNKVVITTCSTRLKLHIAAVFASNFSTLLFSIAYEQLEEEELDFSLLLPLISQTVDKLEAKNNPAEKQTGPAVRRDHKTMDKHLAALKEHPELSDLYHQLSTIISKRHQKK